MIKDYDYYNKELCFIIYQLSTTVGVFWAPPSEYAAQPAQSAPVLRQPATPWVPSAALTLTADQAFANASSVPQDMAPALLPQ
jgi:hypothetical protein